MVVRELFLQTSYTYIVYLLVTPLNFINEFLYSFWITGKIESEVNKKFIYYFYTHFRIYFNSILNTFVACEELSCCQQFTLIMRFPIIAISTSFFEP